MARVPLKLSFYGGVGKVTGANFLLEVPATAAGERPLRILVDCGLVQGNREDSALNYKNFPYPPSSIDLLFITHAHIDHIGRVPKLVRDGFRGTIYSTAETRAMAPLMLDDALGISLHDREGKNPDGTYRAPLYEKADIERALGLWKELPYHKATAIARGLEVFLRDAGHILGSAMFEFSWGKGTPEGERKILFTGDLGNSPTPLLRDTEIASGIDYLVMESVYGDRNHEQNEDRRAKLKAALLRTVERRGTLLIPIFSLEKTQVILHEMRELVATGEVPAIPVFLDSPLAIRLTDIYERMTQDFNEAIQKEVSAGIDPFDFKGLRKTMSRDDSAIIGNTNPPKVIIAGSGMSHGGRILEHEKHYLSNADNAILFVGYQGAGSAGRQIQEGAKEVEINGTYVTVRVEVSTITGYSSHKGSDDLVRFVHETDSARRMKKAFVVMGEDKAALFLVQKLREGLGIEAIHPEAGDTVELV